MDEATASEAKGRRERGSLPQDNLVRAARQHCCCCNNTMSDSFEELVATDGRDGQSGARAQKSNLLVLPPESLGVLSCHIYQCILCFFIKVLLCSYCTTARSFST